MKKKILIGSFSCLIIDLITKYLIDTYIHINEDIQIINNFFKINKVYNTGASFSILTDNIIFLIILLYYQNKFQENTRNMLAFSLLYGGILGNLFDRIFNGYVIDFLDFNFFGYDFPVFNMADIFIVMGIGLLIYAIWKKEDENETSSR